nr:hypothetical protein [Tanacetum cinerariifolium]
MEAGDKDHPLMLSLGSKGGSQPRIDKVNDPYKTVLEDIRNQLDAEAEVVQIILTWIDNDIYSIFNVCPNAMEINRGKAIVNSPSSTYEPEHKVVIDNDAPSKDKEIDKLKALISMSFKKIYKPFNNNLRTSLHTRNVVQQTEIQCYNCKEYRHVARECKKEKRPSDLAYQKEKMMLCKQEEAEIQLSTEETNGIQEVTPDAAANYEPIFDVEPLQRVQHDDDYYNVFANDRQHPEQPESVNDTYLVEQGDINITHDSSDMSNNEEEANRDDDLAKERD